ESSVSPTAKVEKIGDVNASSASTPVPVSAVAPAPTPSITHSVLSHPSPAPSPSVSASTLEILVKHHFASAKLRVFVDDKLAYSNSLQGESKNHLVVFRGIRGQASGKVAVPTGDHHIRVVVQSSTGVYDQSKTITASFTK